MITLYQLHWSHFVEKVRWALDFKRLDWVAVDVDPFSKREMRPLDCKLQTAHGEKLYIVPAIHDDATGVAVADSTKILEYLESAYPTPSLYPSDPAERAEVTRWMLWLDSTIALYARRLAYTQIAVEHPRILTQLFLPSLANGTLKANIAGRIIAGVLSERFRFRHIRADGVYESLEEALLTVADRLDSRPYLVGQQFTAADLTLAALLRPAPLIPFFREHPRLQNLWAWRARLLREQQRKLEYSYETELHNVRVKRGWARGAVGWLSSHTPATRRDYKEIPSLSAAHNDQQPLGRRPELRGYFWYLRLLLTCDLSRTPYPG